MKLLITFLLLSSVSFGQSKKDQIMALNKSIDSLSTVLSTSRDNSAQDIGALSTTIDGLNSEITQLKSDVSSLESSTTKLTKDNEKLKLDLEELSKKNLELEEKLKAIRLKSSNLDTSLFFALMPGDEDEIFGTYVFGILKGYRGQIIETIDAINCEVLSEDEEVYYGIPESALQSILFMYSGGLNVYYLTKINEKYVIYVGGKGEEQGEIKNWKKLGEY
jgi:hypothetical protein